MAELIGELLFAVIRSLVRDWAYSLFLKAGAWLDTKIQGRRMKIAIGLLLGLAAYLLLPIFEGLLGL
jgi:hypothetical protein